ncbi:hypothetical protein ACHQM5_000544 [Ranunculus cassubicifolius]
MKKQDLALFSLVFLFLLAYRAHGLIPYSRNSLWDMMIPNDDPFRILEQTPLTIPKSLDTVALVRVDWKETEQVHVISIDIPVIKKEDVKIEVEENRVLRISGERKTEQQKEGEKWTNIFNYLFLFSVVLLHVDQ